MFERIIEKLKDGTEVPTSTNADATTSSQTIAKPNVIRRLFYFDQNSRVYEMGGIKKNSPFHRGYFRPINVIGENAKELICEYGNINKKTEMYITGRMKFKTYTEQEMEDDIYVADNRHILSEKVRTAKADVLRQIENLLVSNGV